MVGAVDGVGVGEDVVVDVVVVGDDDEDDEDAVDDVV